MARKLETGDLVRIILSVPFPGLPHIFSGKAGFGVPILAIAVIASCMSLYAVVPILGCIAAYMMYSDLTSEDQKELPQVDFKALKEATDTAEREAVKATEDKKAEDKKAEDKKAEDKKAEDKKAEDKKAEDEPAEDEPAEDEPAEDEPAEDEPAEDEPAEDEPAEDEPAEDEPAEDEPAEDEPAEDEPAEDEPAEDEPAEDEPTEEKKEEFEREGSKSRIPSFKLSLPKRGEVSEADADYPELVPALKKRLKVVSDGMHATGVFLKERDKKWDAGPSEAPAASPALFGEILGELGGAEFESMWSHGWPFGPGQTISLFKQLEKEDGGWRFAHDVADPSALALIWLPSGEVVARRGSQTETVAQDLGEFIDMLGEGFRVAQAAIATQAVLEADHLAVLPEDEVEQGSEDATFPDFWMGASGPGLSNVGWSFEPPLIRNPAGTRRADQADSAMIEVFHEWLTTDAESPDGALEIAKMQSNTVRPVGKVLLDGEVVVAWWGESPPEEVDAFIDHLRGRTYAKS